MNMSDIVCIASVDLPKEGGYVLKGAHGKIEAIPGVEQRAGFAVDGLVRAEEPGGELLLSIVIDTEIDRFLV